MGTVTKALTLLRFFTRTRPAVGLSEMSRLSGLNKATTHRLLSELEAQGFVEQVEPGREYRLGAAFLRYAALREAAVPTRDIATQVLSDLSAATHETAHFSLLQKNTLSTIAYVYSPHHGTRVTMENAEILVLHATSSGLAVLAFSPDDFVERALSKPLERFTEMTVTDADAIRAMLPEIRAEGIAEGIGGLEIDTHSHAAPVFDASQKVIGAIAVATPAARMTEDHRKQVRRELRRHALRLTHLLGGFPPEGVPNEEAA